MSTLPGEPTSCLSHVPVTPNRALYIAEILEMILDQLASDNRSICCLATACKAIAGPALDRLWALNHSLEPFISLLPSELTLDEDFVFQYDPLVLLNLPSEKWAAFDKYAGRARRLYAKTVTMNPHRIYSSIYNQLIDIRPNVDLFPNLVTFAFHAKSVPNPHLRMFPSSLRSVTFSWANTMAPEVETVLWSSVMNRLLLDAPLIEQFHFEGSPKEPLTSLAPLPFRRLQKITIKPSPLVPSVLHKYSHALSASAIRELDLRFVRWPDSRIQALSPVFPLLRKLTIDGSPSHAIDLIRLLSSPMLQELTIASQERDDDVLNQFAELLSLLATKYQGVFRTLKIQQPLQCRNQADLESFLDAVRKLGGAGAVTLQMNLVLGWQNLTCEVQEMIEASKWMAFGHFKITSRRASVSWGWTAGNVLFG